MNIKNRVGIHNRFDIEVVDAKTGKVKQRAKAFNVICNTLWSRLLNTGGAAYFTYIHYGSGSGTPAVADTSLFHFEGYKNITADFDSYSTNYKTGVASLRRKVVLDENTAVGINITEVGIAYDSNANSLCTHATLQDMNGNPISIAKTGTDIINIYATIFLHWDNTKDIKIINLGYAPYYDTWYSGKVRCFRNWLFGISGAAFTTYVQTVPLIALGYKEAFWGDYGGFSATPAQSIAMVLAKNTSGNNVASFTADLPNKTMNFVYPRIPATASDEPYMNDGGIGCFVLLTNTETRTQSGYSTAPYGPILIECGGTSIPPSRITSETIGTGDGTNTKFKTKFDFPYNATVYVNGVAVNSGVTVKKLPRVNSNYFSRYIRKLNSQSDANHIIPCSGVSNGSGIYFASTSDAYEMYTGDGTNPSWNIPHSYKCDEVGISKVRIDNNSGRRFYISDDLENWEEITGNGDVELPANKQHFKYFKFTGSGSVYLYLWYNSYDGNNVIFDTPPAAGDVITIDYTTPYLAKDENHVLDLSFSITFGEWTGE